MMRKNLQLQHFKQKNPYLILDYYLLVKNIDLFAGFPLTPRHGLLLSTRRLHLYITKKTTGRIQIISIFKPSSRRGAGNNEFNY